MIMLVCVPLRQLADSQALSSSSKLQLLIHMLGSVHMPSTTLSHS